MDCKPKIILSIMLPHKNISWIYTVNNNNKLKIFTFSAIRKPDKNPWQPFYNYFLKCSKHSSGGQWPSITMNVLSLKYLIFSEFCLFLSQPCIFLWTPSMFGDVWLFFVIPQIPVKFCWNSLITYLCESFCNSCF